MNASRVWIACVAIAGVGLTAIGCAGADPAGATPDRATATVTVAPTIATSPSVAGQVIDIVAEEREFSLIEIEVAAGSGFEIRFDNQDEYSHAIYITESVRPPRLTSEAEAMAFFASSLFKGEYITGPATITYHVAGLAPGTYQFFCPPHPPMIGTLVVK